MGQPRAALSTLQTMIAEAPAALPLAAALLVEVAETSGQTDQVLQGLQQHYAAAPSLDVLDAIVALTEKAGQATSPDACGICATWILSLRWWRPPNGWQVSASSMSNTIRRYNAPWTMPPSL